MGFNSAFKGLTFASKFHPHGELQWNVKQTDFNTVYNIKTPVSTPCEHNRDFLLFYLVAWWVRSRYTTTEFQYSEMPAEHISIHLEIGQEKKNLWHIHNI